MSRLFVVVACCLGPSHLAAQTPVARKHTETLLAPFPAAVWDSAIISPNLRRVACVSQTAAGQQVIVNGQEDKLYQTVAGLAFSPDSKQLAYAASPGDKWFIVLGGKEQGPYEQVGLPEFSPDSQHLACVAMLPDGQRAVFLDGKPGKPCEMVFEGIIVFSPDSRRVAYGARRAAGWFLVAGDQEFGPYEFLGSSTGIQFSRDGSRLAFAALVNKKWCVILDGKPQPAYDNLGPLVFSPDGKRVAYTAMQKERDRETWQAVLDGKPGTSLDAIGQQTLLFSPDGKHLAYAAQAGRQWCVVLDGKPGQQYDGIGQVRFSPNGQLLAYVAKRQSAEAVVTEPTAVGPAPPAAAADRRRPAQPALPAANEGPPRFFDRIGGGTLVFSPSGRHLAYVAGHHPQDGRGRWSFVVADGNRKPRYDLVGYLTFTPDGRWPVYAAVKGKKTFTVVEDKEATHQYDAIWMPRGEPLRFVAPARFRYLAVKEGSLYLVEERLD